MTRWLLGLCAGLSLALAALAGGAAAADPIALDDTEIRALVTGKTTDCLKISDGKTCATWFRENGVIKRIMDEDGERTDGTWMVDTGMLCVTWEGKDYPLCFDVLDMRDGSYQLIRNDKHKSTITKIMDGNPRGM